MRRFLKLVGWVICVLASAYIAAGIYAFPHDHQEHLDEAAVAKIEVQKITIADVDGTNLPPQPDPILNDMTVAGIDANTNGIRDDVELALFSEYPTTSVNSTAIRSAELQHVLDLQIQLTEVFDTATWIAAQIQSDRGFGCIWDASNGKYASFEDEIEKLVLNTQLRNAKYAFIEQYGASYKLSMDPDCDVSRS